MSSYAADYSVDAVNDWFSYLGNEWRLSCGRQIRSALSTDMSSASMFVTVGAGR